MVGYEQNGHLKDILDVHGTLAIENIAKVVYVKCIRGQQLLRDDVVPAVEMLASIVGVQLIRFTHYGH
jgi:hypothetical protein